MASIPSWAKPGAKVVCVHHELLNGTRFVSTPPPIGEPVKVLGFSRPHMVDQSIGLIIEGYPNVSRVDGQDIGWHVARLRPAVEPKTEAEDVALFQDIARKANMVTEEVDEQESV